MGILYWIILTKSYNYVQKQIFQYYSAKIILLYTGNPIMGKMYFGNLPWLYLTLCMLGNISYFCCLQN